MGRLAPGETAAGGKVSLQSSLLLEFGAAWTTKPIELELVALLEALAKVLILVESREAATTSVFVPALLVLKLHERIVAGGAIADFCRSGLHLALPAAIHFVLLVVGQVPLTLIPCIRQQLKNEIKIVSELEQSLELQKGGRMRLKLMQDEVVAQRNTGSWDDHVYDIVGLAYDLRFSVHGDRLSGIQNTQVEKYF